MLNRWNSSSSATTSNGKLHSLDEITIAVIQNEGGDQNGTVVSSSSEANVLLPNVGI